MAIFRWPALYIDKAGKPGPVGDAAMAADDKQSFVADIAQSHGQRLRRFLARKLPAASQDVPDLMQEIYLRLCRVRRHEVIRSPQAYLFTVAIHVLYQHRLSNGRIPQTIDVLEELGDSEAYSVSDPSTVIDARQRLAEMDVALRQLPRNVYATFVLSRQYGYSLEEIAGELRVSRGMVKKYLARALAHIRTNLEAERLDTGKEQPT